MSETQANYKILTLVLVLYLLLADGNANDLRTDGLQDITSRADTGTPCAKVIGVPSLKEFENGCYYFETSLEGNYLEALQFCNYRGMKLLSIESKEEQQFVTQNIQTIFGTQNYNFWTSGAILPDNSWVWLSTGKPFVYTDWRSNRTDDDAENKEKCLALQLGTSKNDSLWNDVECSYPKLPICEIQLTEDTYNVNEAIVGTSSSLPLERFEDEYYYFGESYKGTYFQALQYCNSHGMDLLSIETKEEQDFVVKHIQSKYGKKFRAFWTSGTNLPNNYWVWLATGKPIVFTKWNSNQPDNYKNNEHCLELAYKKSNRNILWNDHTCAVAKRVICEINAKGNILKLVSDSFNFTLQTADVIKV